jgi:hypothetical protein
MPVGAYTSLSTTLTTEIGNAITAAMPVAGIVLGAYVGFKLYKHFVK